MLNKKSGNPVLGEEVFSNLSGTGSETMTVNGTITKTALLLMTAFASALYSWDMFKAGTLGGGDMTIALILALVAALVTTFKKEWANIAAPIYALCEGFVLGGISAMFDHSMPGLPFQAILLTFATCGGMLLLYRMGIIRATDRFKSVIFTATMGIGIFYLISMVMSMFGMQNALIHGNGMLSIGLSFIITGIAALNLIIDFDFIEQGAKYNAPKYMEWYGGFALMVTLVWLYIEMLRLLSKLNSRD